MHGHAYTLMLLLMFPGTCSFEDCQPIGGGDPGPIDSSDAGVLNGPDLVVEEITRGEHYYHVRFCNYGEASMATLLVRLTNLDTGESFTSNHLYPYTVPDPNDCRTTGGFTCGLIGDSGCVGSLSVEATVDSEHSVLEIDEGNNSASVGF